MNLIFWKRQQLKNQRRRATVRARNLHRMKSSHIIRSRMVGGVEYTPLHMQPNMVAALMALMMGKKASTHKSPRAVSSGPVVFGGLARAGHDVRGSGFD